MFEELREPLKYDVFITYNRTTDRGVAEMLASKLSEEGLKPFLDLWELSIGESFHTTIQDALLRSRLIAVILSPSAADESPWMSYERDFIRKSGMKRVIPLVIDNAPLPPWLEHSKDIKLVAGSEETFAGAAREIADILGRVRTAEVMDAEARNALNKPSATLPALDQRGYLPEGLYHATLSEVLERFGRGSSQRAHLATELGAIEQRAREMGAEALLLGGSFISDKPHPGDVDIVIVIPERIPDEILTSGYAAVQAYVSGGKNTFVASGAESVRYWRDFLANKFLNEPRGVVRIDITGGMS